MLLVFGIGNPGKKYKYTRHNIGFLAIDKLSKFFKIKLSFKNTNIEYGYTKYKNYKIILAKPLLFVNNSGKPLFFLLKKFTLLPKQIIVIYDDLDLDLGKIRIREKGSAGGHKGLLSIIEELKTEEFPRIRIGINRPSNNEKIENFILTEFKKDEFTLLEKKLNLLPEIITTILFYNISFAMSKYNQKNINLKKD